MLAFFYLIIVLLNLGLFLYGRRGKLTEVLTGGFAILFAIGKRYVGGYICYDLQHYESNYRSLADMKEVGYAVLRNMCVQFGLSFYEFYMFLIAAFMIILFITAKKRGINMHLMYSALLIYYIFIPTSQIKCFCAFVILFISTKWALSEEKKDIFKFAIGVFVASLFHPAYILYMSLIVVKFSKSERFPKIFGVMFAGFCILVIVSNSQQMVANLISAYLADFNTYDRYDKYFRSVSHLAPVSIIIIWGIYVCLIYYWRKIFDNTSIAHNISMLGVSHNVCTMAVVSCFFLPLLFMNMTMYRMIRDLSFIILCYSSIGINCETTRLRNRSVICALSLGIVTGLFAYDIIIKGYWNDYLIYYFTNAIL